MAAIYEPPQTSTPDGVELLEDPNEKVLVRIVSYLPNVVYIFLIFGGGPAVYMARFAAGWLDFHRPLVCRPCEGNSSLY